MKTETPISIARKAAKKTQKQVAREIGVAERLYQYYEYGTIEPGVKAAGRVLTALGKSAGDIDEMWPPERGRG